MVNVKKGGRSLAQAMKSSMNKKKSKKSSLKKVVKKQQKQHKVTKIMIVPVGSTMLGGGSKHGAGKQTKRNKTKRDKAKAKKAASILAEIKGKQAPMPTILQAGEKAPKKPVSHKAIPYIPTGPMPVILQPGQKRPKTTPKSQVKVHKDFNMPIVVQAPKTKKGGRGGGRRCRFTGGPGSV